MVENGNTQPFGLLFIVTVHIVFNDAGPVQVTGIIGQNVTLKFTFNTTIKKDSNFAVYTTGEQKISDITKFKHCFEVYPENSSVFYHITNLTLNHSEIYWATLFGGTRHLTPSDKVQLIIRKGNRSTTVPPIPTKLTKPSISGSSSLSSHVLTVLVVLSVILSVALLPFLICCLVKPKGQRQEEPQRGSNPTVQETIEEPPNVPGPSLVYCVLDFPKRPPAAAEFDPSGTEYATVGYLTEKRHGSHADHRKSPDRSRLK